MHPVNRAASVLGSKAALARALRVTKAAVSQWMDVGRSVPAERCPDIERLTNGAVRCEDLRPDIPWGVLRTSTTPPDPSAAPLAAVDSAARIGTSLCDSTSTTGLEA